MTWRITLRGAGIRIGGKSERRAMASWRLQGGGGEGEGECEAGYKVVDYVYESSRGNFFDL